MTTSRVAAVQMASGPNVVANLQDVARHIATARADGAALVVLPEFFALMGACDADLVAAREVPGAGAIQDFLAAKGRQHGICLVAGGVPLATGAPDRIRAAYLLYDEHGTLRARYDKLHLFDVTVPGSAHAERYSESAFIERGREVVVADTPFGRLGLAACYDLRFPEMFRSMLADGLDLIAVPSAFTAITGRAHWETLVRARAIENFCYVVAAAQGGFHVGGRETFGDSMIVDPWGSILARRRKGGGVVVHDMDPSRIASIRRAFPAIDHIQIATRPS